MDRQRGQMPALFPRPFLGRCHAAELRIEASFQRASVRNAPTVYELSRDEISLASERECLTRGAFGAFIRFHDDGADVMLERTVTADG